MDHLDHVARSLGALAWLLDHGTRPTPGDLVRQLLPSALPATPTEQLAVLAALRARLGALVVRSGRHTQHLPAFAAVDAAIGSRQ